jgi:hypothetical protein
MDVAFLFPSRQFGMCFARPAGLRLSHSRRRAKSESSRAGKHSRDSSATERRERASLS